MTQIINEFMECESVQGDQIRRIVKEEGRQIDDETLVALLAKRLQFRDCVTQGYVIENFPTNRNQAVLMAKKGIVPNNLFYIKTSIKETYERTEAAKTEKFGCNRLILT